MQRQLSHELEVSVGADQVWEVYGGLKLLQVVSESFPIIFENIEVVAGDGGVGTILNLIFPQPMFPNGARSYKEKFTKIDNDNRIKETEVIEGGYLDNGFSFYRVRFEIVEKEVARSSIIKSSVEYQLAEEFAANASLVSTGPFGLIARTVATYLAV